MTEVPTPGDPKPTQTPRRTREKRLSRRERTRRQAEEDRKTRLAEPAHVTFVNAEASPTLSGLIERVKTTLPDEDVISTALSGYKYKSRPFSPGLVAEAHTNLVLAQAVDESNHTMLLDPVTSATTDNFVFKRTDHGLNVKRRHTHNSPVVEYDAMTIDGDGLLTVWNPKLTKDRIGQYITPAEINRFFDPLLELKDLDERSNKILGIKSFAYVLVVAEDHAQSNEKGNRADFKALGGEIVHMRGSYDDFVALAQRITQK